MRSVYMTAISPVKGAEGDLKKYHMSCTEELGWHSPLPLLVPLKLWKASFPRDRVDTGALKTLPPLELSGPVNKEGFIYLQMSNPEKFDSLAMFREIHGKTVPPEESISFLSWQGLLLHCSAGRGLNLMNAGFLKVESNFSFRTWQLGLYKIRYDESRHWWEDLSVSALWKVRKPS